ncbi:MAG: hypothetical protein H0T53_16720, partial [Herpetosiphonaceae bacterium]|nr:hypothetical protein [Herpetosiphonaceae bacterium]
MDLDHPDTVQLADLSRRYPSQELVPEELAGQPIAAVVGPLFAISPTLTQVLLLRGSIWLDGKRV